MKPKTTLNLLKDYFSNIIEKGIQFLFSLFANKIWSDTLKISNILSVVSHSSLTFLKSVFEITSIETDQTKNIKSAPPELKYYYTLNMVNV